MSNYNTENNRAVWFDIPVSDFDRADAFYAAVLDIEVHRQDFDGMTFSVLEHKEGNGGCLVKDPEAVTGTGGILVYMNVDGRIQDAVKQVQEHGGTIVQPVHAIGPHGFRALILDSEGNRVALHSDSDA